MLGRAVRGAYYGKTDATFGPLGGQNIYYDLEEKRDGGTIITDPSVSTRWVKRLCLVFWRRKPYTQSGVSNDEDVVLAGLSRDVRTDLATLLKGRDGIL